MSFLSGLFKKTGASSSKTATAAPPASTEDIRRWMANKVARRLKVEATSLDVHASFAQLGLDSLAAVDMSGELEKWLNLEIEATILYEYPSINELAEHLAKRLGLV